MNEIKYSNGRFDGNSLVVVRTGCGKQLQNLSKNKHFGDIKEVFWISKIEQLSNKRK